MSGGNGKDKVVAIKDRRASKGAEDKPSAPPDPGTPKDRNERVQPMVVNRNDLDPFAILRSGRGAGREERRCIVELDDRTRRMHQAGTASFYQLSELVRQLAVRDESTRAWMARPWWKRLAFWRKPPKLAELTVPEVAMESEGAETPAEPEAHGEPS